MKLLACLIAVFTVVSSAQDTGLVQVKLVKGAPFSALVISQTIQTLSDGNQINHSTNATIARDSEGRTRRDQTLPDGSIITFLQDPTTGYAYVLHPLKKSAHRYQIATAAGSTTNAQSANIGESLGSQTIEGIQADGTRMTRTMAANEGGNQQALQVTTEVWYSNELQTVVSRKTTYPQASESTYRLTNMQRTEPDHSLFEVPADFIIIIEQTIQTQTATGRK